MAQEFRSPAVDARRAELDWTGLYRAAGVGLLVTVVFVVLDIAMSFTGGDVEMGSLSAVEWFAYFQNNWLLGLRNLGLFNVINMTLTIPLYLALYRLHRGSSPALAALALIAYLVGAAVYIANNRALALLELSSQYAAASEAHRAVLAAAGTVVLAQAEDFTPGSFMGFFFSNTASLLMMVAILRGGVFRRWIGLTGLVGSACLFLFTLSATFVPSTFAAAMVVALVGGLLMLAWNIIMALRMLGMGRMAAQPAEVLPLPRAASGGKGLEAQ